MRWAQSTSELRISLQCTWIPLSSLGCTYMSPSLHRLFLGCWWLATAAIFRAYVVSWALLLAHLRASLFPPGGNTDIAKTKCSGVKDHQLECFWLKTCCQAIYFPTVFFFFFLYVFCNEGRCSLQDFCLSACRSRKCVNDLWIKLIRGLSGVTRNENRNERCWAGRERKTSQQFKSEWYLMTFCWNQGKKE